MSFFEASNPHLYIAVVLAIANGILLCFAAYKFFQMIQITGYRLKGYFLWLRDTKAKYVSRLFILVLLSIACVLVTNTLFDSYKSATFDYSYFGLIFYFYFTIIFIINMYAAPKKIPLKQTRRMTRMNIFMFLMSAGVSFLLIAFSTELIPILKFGILCVTPILIPILAMLVCLLISPLEEFITSMHVKRAKLKLSKLDNLIKIGITGSYGKTSTKYILNSMLSEKYSVCMSPHSFNTVVGIAKVVNDYLKPENEILIAEMGARNKGDIKELASFVKPKYGIITSIGSQHLLSFGTLENISNTKYELIEALPSDGFAIFNGTNKGAYELYNKCTINKSAVGECVGSDIKAEAIKVDKDGTHFTLKIKDDKIKCSTKLIGKHNVENILVCVQMCLQLGLTSEQIKDGIAKLKPIPHRLELKENDKGVIVFDDSYNASVESTEVALEVIKGFSKKTKKIVITPGLIELGRKEKEENFNFGVKMAAVADYIVIVNKVNLEAIRAGIESTGYNMDNVYEAETLDKAKVMLEKLVTAGDVILFENDLPDNYI